MPHTHDLAASCGSFHAATAVGVGHGGGGAASDLGSEMAQSRAQAAMIGGPRTFNCSCTPRKPCTCHTRTAEQQQQQQLCSSAFARTREARRREQLGVAGIGTVVQLLYLHSTMQHRSRQVRPGNLLAILALLDSACPTKSPIQPWLVVLEAVEPGPLANSHAEACGSRGHTQLEIRPQG
ncbi:hypothetical protein IWZ01DRAFT_184629 [Phyllosticta capitalensis]